MIGARRGSLIPRPRRWAAIPWSVASALVVAFLLAPTAVAVPTTTSTWVTLTGPTALLASPDPDADEQITLAGADEEGLPISVPVIRQQEAGTQRWLKIRYGGALGWIPAAGTVESPSEPLTPRLVDVLSRLSELAGARSGVAVSDSSGQPLFARNADRPLILASNTKLFVTGPAVVQFGASISSLLRRILLPSDNELAQTLLERLGAQSAARGSAVATGFAREQGARVTLADGSGLSRLDRAAAADVVRFLVGMRHQRGFRTWAAALPVTGRSGTLAYRLRGTKAEAACQAKTGTLHDVSSLSGYCTTGSGRRVVYSMLMNRISPFRGRALQDRMLAELVRLG